MTILLVALGLFGLYLSLYVAYQCLLFGANAWIPDPPEREPSRLRRFNVVIPAHNEELLLPRLLESLTSQEYPREHFRVTVVADNCTDGTVAACDPFDVDVLERHDSTNRGKGHAIGWTLAQLPLDRFDAVVIVDGDSLVDRGFLRHLNLQMDRGDEVVQCYNAVANPGQSWFTRLMDVSRTISNEIIHPGKRKLGLSSHLMGNGMCFDVRVLRSLGWNAYSVGEDCEYYAQLIHSGRYVGYSRLARVYHQESVSLRQASTQRLRWASARFGVLGNYGSRLVLRGLRERDLRCIDAALPLAFPNPSLGVNLTVLGLAAALVYRSLGGSIGVAVWFVLLALAQLGMFVIGVFHTRDRAASAVSLVLAPLFLAWKLGIDVLALVGVGRDEWKHTHRRAS
jgi:cellulose synthase/poly-beta-1,6-N-acetylglucosamine synthase-like glycosyltransferase